MPNERLQVNKVVQNAIVSGTEAVADMLRDDFVQTSTVGEKEAETVLANIPVQDLSTLLANNNTDLQSQSHVQSTGTN